MKNPPRIKTRYYAVKPGEWIFPIANSYKLACCDCGLVHLMDFRPVNKSRIKMRAYRDNRATAAVRRRKHDKT